jgi:hypothetical protein
MMLNGKEIGRALVITPPQATASFIASAGTTAATVGMSTLGPQTPGLGNSNSIVVGAFNAEVTVQNDGPTNTLYVIFATTSALAASISAAATGTNATGAAYAIPPNSERRVRVRNGVDNFMGYITSTSTTTVRVFVTSDQG